MHILLGDSFGCFIQLKNFRVVGRIGEIKRDREVRKIMKSDNGEIFAVLKDELCKYNFSSGGSSILKPEENAYFLSSSLRASDLLLLSSNAKLTLADLHGEKTAAEINIGGLNSSEDFSYLKSVFFFKEKKAVLVGKNKSGLLFDIEKKCIECFFGNSRNDEFSLKVPVYDTDFSPLSDSSFLLSSAYGNIRKFDLRQGIKPIFDVKVNEGRINRIVLSSDKNYLIFGDSRGICRKLDLRKDFSVVKNFRGDPCSIRDLVYLEPMDTLLVGGLGRYLRIFRCDEGDSEAVFIKSNITSMLVVDYEKPKEEEEEEEENEEEEEEEES